MAAVVTPIENATLNDLQKASVNAYLKRAEEVFKKHYEGLPEVLFGDYRQNYLDKLKEQNFTKIFDAEGKPISHAGATPQSLEQFLETSERIHFAPLSKSMLDAAVGEAGHMPNEPSPRAGNQRRNQEFPPGASAEERAEQVWLNNPRIPRPRMSRSEIAHHGKQIAGVASVGVGSVMLMDGLYGAITPTKRTVIKDDGTLSKERVTPLSHELAKITVGGGLTGAGYVLALERTHIPGI